MSAELNDLFFNEVFIATADPGFEFLHWKKASFHLFGCNTSVNNPINTAAFEGGGFEPFLSQSLVTIMRPIFRSTGAEILYTTDYECNDINAGVLGDGWVSFVNVFENDGTTYVGGYSVGGGAPNGDQISALTSGQGGAEQDKRQLNVFSNYDSNFNMINQHATGQQVEVNVFQEYTLIPGSQGTYTFTFDAKLPSESALAVPSTANVFVKVLDPANGFQTVAGTLDAFDSASLTTDWSTQSVTVVVTAGMANTSPTQLVLQFGFQNTATSFNPTGVIYDNVVFRKNP